MSAQAAVRMPPFPAPKRQFLSSGAGACDAAGVATKTPENPATKTIENTKHADQQPDRITTAPQKLLKWFRVSYLGWNLGQAGELMSPKYQARTLVLAVFASMVAGCLTSQGMPPGVRNDVGQIPTISWDGTAPIELLFTPSSSAAAALRLNLPNESQGRTTTADIAMDLDSEGDAPGFVAIDLDGFGPGGLSFYNVPERIPTELTLPFSWHGDNAMLLLFSSFSGTIRLTLQPFEGAPEHTAQSVELVALDRAPQRIDLTEENATNSTYWNGELSTGSSDVEMILVGARLPYALQTEGWRNEVYEFPRGNVHTYDVRPNLITPWPAPPFYDLVFRQDPASAYPPPYYMSIRDIADGCQPAGSRQITIEREAMVPIEIQAFHVMILESSPSNAESLLCDRSVDA